MEKIVTDCSGFKKSETKVTLLNQGSRQLKTSVPLSLTLELLGPFFPHIIRNVVFFFNWRIFPLKYEVLLSESSISGLSCFKRLPITLFIKIAEPNLLLNYIKLKNCKTNQSINYKTKIYQLHTQKIFICIIVCELSGQTKAFKLFILFLRN